MMADEPKSVWLYANHPLCRDIFKTFFWQNIGYTVVQLVRSRT